MGVVSWRVEGETIDLHRLVVEPAHFRQGVGSALVSGAVAAEPGARRAEVQIGAANGPAIALYRREGFVPVDEFEPVSGLRVARFNKCLRATGEERIQP